MNPRYPLVASRAGHRCEYCRAPESIFNLSFEVEHIVPESREGSDDESNWALACRSCNVYKADRVEGLDELEQVAVRLFHPRRDRWEEHFVAEIQSAAIVGLTATGRVTVSALQMNREIQLVARRQWILLRLFP
jgi:hypothetical protein